MLTRGQAEDLAMQLAVQSSKWSQVLVESRPQALREILKERDEILAILEHNLHQIRD